MTVLDHQKNSSFLPKSFLEKQKLKANFNDVMSVNGMNYITVKRQQTMHCHLKYSQKQPPRYIVAPLFYQNSADIC